MSTISFLDLVDILLVALILYKLYEMLQDTRAITIVKGLIVLLALTMVSNWLGLHVIYWLLQKTVTLLFVAPADRFPAGAAADARTSWARPLFWPIDLLERRRGEIAGQ